MNTADISGNEAKRNLVDDYLLFNLMKRAFQLLDQNYISEFEKNFSDSGLSEEDFNKQEYKDHGDVFPVVQAGKIELRIILKLPENSRRSVKPEKALKLFQENLSIKEIADCVKRSENG